MSPYCMECAGRKLEASCCGVATSLLVLRLLAHLSLAEPSQIAILVLGMHLGNTQGARAIPATIPRLETKGHGKADTFCCLGWATEPPWA